MCAVALKSGRACGMFNHTAVDCFAKKMFIPPLEDQNETPAPDMPIEVLSSPNVTSEPPPPMASPEPCAARLRAISASEFNTMFDQLALARFKVPGHGGKPEPPTLVCKVSQQGGVLLSGLPTQGDKQAFEEVTLQIYCFGPAPYRKKIRGKQAPGIQIPSARLIRVNMDSQRAADAEFRSAFQALINAVLEGELVNVHCVAGVHRAASLSAVFRAALHQESIDEAIAAITRLRAVEIPKAIKQYDKAGWCDGDFGSWLIRHTDIAKGMWQKALADRGENKLAKTKKGSVIHLVKLRDNQTATESVTPECLYRQKPTSAKAFFGPGSTLTKSSGKDAAREALQWTFAAGHLQVCTNCAKHLSAGMLTVLENGSISVPNAEVSKK